MSAADEQSRARGLIALRLQAWRCLLDYPPFAEAMAGVIEASGDDEHPAPIAALEQVRRAARALRERDTQATLAAYVRARDELASAMHKHRGEAELLRTLADEVAAIAGVEPRGRAERVLVVRTPPTGSRVFASYVEALGRVRAELSAARQVFVAANLRLVVTIARRYNHPFLSPADLIQEGTLGLLRAVDGFDPDRGTRFSTYAAWWIKHGITRAISNYGLTVRVPANVLGLRSQISKLEQGFIADRGRPPSNEELAKAIGAPLRTVANARKAVLGRVESIAEGDEAFVDEQPWDVDALLDAPYVERELLELIEHLPGIEGAVIRKRFALDGRPAMTLQEIGEQHSLSRERIRQIEKQALERMRGSLLDRGICAA